MKVDSNLISIGTARIGNTNYGFSSKIHNRDFDEITFFESVVKLGIKNIDTSPRYGNAQEILGRFIKNNNSPFLVSSKIDNLIPGNKKVALKVIEDVKKTLEVLNVEKLEICYLHQNEIEIISDKYIIEGLLILKDLNYIKSIGASIYNNIEFDYVINSNIFDVIQCPINATDLKFNTKFLEQKNNSKKIIARSIYLQGLLLNYSKNDIQYMPNDMLDYFQYLDYVSKKLSLSRSEFVKSLIFSLNNIHQYIIGTNKAENLCENISYTKLDLSNKLIVELMHKANECKSWTNPRNWNFK